MTKHLSILLLSLLLASCASTSAPTNGGNTTPTGQTVTGTVKDTSGRPVGNATVTIEENFVYSTQTDTGGRFTFSNVPAGTFLLRARMAKYSTDSQTVVVSNSPVSGVTFTIYRTEPLTPEAGLVCRYNFTGNVVDSSKNHHDGSMQGCTFVADRFNHPGEAIQFNGSSDLVSIPDAPDLNFDDSTSFTICLWLRWDSTMVTGVYPLSKMDLSSQSPGYALDLRSTYIQGIVNAGSASYPVYFSSTSPSIWTFFVLVVDRTRELLLPWVNGLQVTQGPGPGKFGSTYNTLPLYLGQSFNGALDDLRIYNRVLSADEIGEIYHERGWR